MIFLTLLYLWFFSRPWSILALPTDLQPLEILPRNHLQSIFMRDEETRFGTRSVYNILWSCLSTIFTCTWITVHPNIPAPGDSKWAVLRRRAAIMGYVLLAPEFVILWAARQQYGARQFTKGYEENHPGWTRAHTFFLIMGGFTLHEGGKPVQVLEPKELEILWKAGEIEWPTITKEEIADRSKGDYLFKTIVLFQTTWFVGQCIARWAHGLTVTELEVVTVAFASLTGVIYYLWWDKPLDVRCSIPVHRLEGYLGNLEGGIEKEETGSQISSSPKISGQEIPERDENVVDIPNSLPTTSIQVDTSTPDTALTRMQRFRVLRRGACEQYGTIFGLGYVFIGFPLDHLLGAFANMMSCDTLGDNPLRVPTFYSPDTEGDYDIVIPGSLAGCVATVFGAIHCIAWSFHFATFQERWLWRISAILVLGLPISMWAVVGFHVLLELVQKDIATIVNFIGMVMSWCYLIARITLLILPFVALRALPPGAYVEINWVSFLPHI